MTIYDKQQMLGLKFNNCLNTSAIGQTYPAGIHYFSGRYTHSYPWILHFAWKYPADNIYHLSEILLEAYSISLHQLHKVAHWQPPKQMEMKWLKLHRWCPEAQKIIYWQNGNGIASGGNTWLIATFSSLFCVTFCISNFSWHTHWIQQLFMFINLYNKRLIAMQTDKIV